jgi:hypothetical protein
MSARLNQNETRYVSWKGDPKKLLTSSLVKNKNSMEANRYTLRFALPLKIYRKEIASTNNCDSKRIKIDDLNQPGGSTITVSTNELGSRLYYDLSLPNSKYEVPQTRVSSNTACLTIEQNAKKRVRSSGNIKRVFNVNANNDLSYYADTKQYLEARNRLFTQNHYTMTIKNNATVKPGAPGSETFLYKTNGTNHCPDFYIISPITFSYSFPYNAHNYQSNIDPSKRYGDVIIPPGYYTDVAQINNLLIKTMITKNHYYINKTTNQPIYLLSISYDYVSNRILLNTLYTAFDLYNSENTLVPTDITLSLSSKNELEDDYRIGPYFILDNPSAADFFGFSIGSYPNGVFTRGPLQTPDKISSTNVGISTPPFMQKNYTPLYYKPNNSQYAQQGAVSASSRITRLKYNTITTNALKYRTSLGESVGNALAYGVSDTTYSSKDKLGFPNKKTPKFEPHTGKLIACCKDK